MSWYSSSDSSRSKTLHNYASCYYKGHLRKHDKNFHVLETLQILHYLTNAWPNDLSQCWVIVNWTLRNKLQWNFNRNTQFLAATKQLYDWFSPSVRPSVRLSVCHTFFTMFPSSYHQFSGVITMVKSDVHAKGQGHRSKVKVTEVNTQLSRFRTLTPVWIHIWQ